MPSIDYLLARQRWLKDDIVDAIKTLLDDRDKLREDLKETALAYLREKRRADMAEFERDLEKKINGSYRR